MAKLCQEHGGKGTAMADSREERGEDDLVADFGARVDELRRDGVSAYPPLGAQKPWTEITEVRKLQEIVWQSWVSSHGSTVPGSASLEAIERYVDYAGLPEVQRDMLVDLRAKLDSGLFGEVNPDGTDGVSAALGGIVASAEFDEKLAAWKQRQDEPWSGVPDDEKVHRLVDVAQVDIAGVPLPTPPGAHMLAAIEREVDFDRLSPWRRERWKACARVSTAVRSMVSTRTCLTRATAPSTPCA